MKIKQKINEDNRGDRKKSKIVKAPLIINLKSKVEDKIRKNVNNENGNVVDINKNIQDNQIIQDSDPVQGMSERNAQCCYYGQIMKSILQQQNQFKIDQNYLKYHTVMNSKIRIFLVKYLYKTYIKFKLKKTTLFLAVYYMDSYLQNNIQSNQYILLLTAQTALHISIKYEEIYPPKLIEWVSQKQLMNLINHEAQMLKTLDYKLNNFTIQHFNEYHHKLNKLTKQQNSMLGLLIDLSLFDSRMYRYKSSLLMNYYMKMIYKQEDRNNRQIKTIKWMIQQNSGNIKWLIQINPQICLTNNQLSSLFIFPGGQMI